VVDEIAPSIAAELALPAEPTTPPVLDAAALEKLERDLAAGSVEGMGDVWERLRAILDEPQQRALVARLAADTDPQEPSR
jgi:hypothetical protein